MRVLIIKLTSMGDLIHALPALTDAGRRFPELEVDWVVDNSFREVPAWHPTVKRVIISAHRQWKHNFWHHWFNGDYRRFIRCLNRDSYDFVVDMQNNLKSALISCLYRGVRHGMDRDSVREKPAHWVYQRRYSVAQGLHAITRSRRLLSQVMGYPCPDTPPDYGVDPSSFSCSRRRRQADQLVPTRFRPKFGGPTGIVDEH